MATKTKTKAPAKPKGFTPTPAPVAPAGTYDPSLDAQLRAADRGLLYTQQDAEQSGERASTAYKVGVEQNDTTTGWSLADALTNKTRGHTDLATALSRSREDTAKATGTLGRNYAELGAGQTAKASSGAFVDTGSIAAAGAVRGANQTRDQADIDQGESRFESDNALAGSRLDETYTTDTGRINQQHDWTQGGLAQSLQYNTDDNATAVNRGTTENNFYGQDVAGAKMYQATSSGLYTPPAKPSNEFTDEKGPYQVIVAHGLRFKLRPNGTREAAGVAK